MDVIVSISIAIYLYIAVLHQGVVFYLQGEIEIRDGDYRSDRVQIQVEKSGPSEAVVDGITTNQTLFDIGHGTVFVLQLVRQLPSLFIRHKTPHLYCMLLFFLMPACFHMCLIAWVSVVEFSSVDSKTFSSINL